MRLDKIRFARLVAFITTLNPQSHIDLEYLDSLCDINVKPVSTELIEASRVDDLLRYMQRGEKINAIKAYRSLTGASLLESKNAVELHWGLNQTLGDILDNARNKC